MVLRYWGPVLPNQRQVERQGQLMELSRLPETSENSTPFFILRKTEPTGFFFRGFWAFDNVFSLFTINIKFNKQRYKNLACVFFFPRFQSWFIIKKVYWNFKSSSVNQQGDVLKNPRKTLRGFYLKWVFVSTQIFVCVRSFWQLKLQQV